MPIKYPVHYEVARGIAARRRAIGWTQARLAMAAGVSCPSLEKYETGRTGIPPAALERLERTLAEAEREALAALQARVAHDAQAVS